ncbi:hypothetical protein HRbin34_00540 [bacterium HR34]|nr:hypothetical protein HRbin34_00540 [bacterium HR34]
MLARIILNTIAGALGIWIANQIIDEVIFTGNIKSLLIIGFVFGILNTIIKPILKLITWPLRVITFGLFTIVINMAMVWLLELFFPDLLDIKGIIPLFYTTLIVWILSTFFTLPLKNK